MTTNKERFYFIDFLKSIGLLLIIFAHINAPGYALAVRAFDVPLMVIISSILAQKSYIKYENIKGFPYEYLIRRVKRLVIPTWIFLVFYFCLLFLLTNEVFSLKYYFSSFLLTRYGIGYVWVILIYMYSAILVPLFSKFKLNTKFVISIFVIYILYELAFYFCIGKNNLFVDTFFYYIIPYGLLTFLGYNYNHFSKKAKYLITIFSFVIFILLALIMYKTYGSPQSPSIAKYPPRLYFLSYGIFVSFTLLILCQKFNLKIFKSKIVNYISKHSLWIYLWHIVSLKLYKILNLPKIWPIEFIVILGFSIIITFLVNKSIDLIEKKWDCKFLSYFRG